MAKGKWDKWIEEDGLIRIQGWARDGLTQDQIAKNMGIACSTLKVWKEQFPAISAALKESKDVADRAVENALYKAACEGNITAMIFWLKNRKPDKWRDKPQEVVNDDEETGVIMLPPVMEDSDA